MKLTFGIGNAKLADDIATFSLPSGWTCPFAKTCLAKADRKTGKVKDGKHTKIRCFSASQESTFPSIRKSRWNNFELLRGKTTAEMVELIQVGIDRLPRNVRKVRIHVAGDFFSQDYFDSWLMIAGNNPDLLFYAYTKSIPYWRARLNFIPKNFVLTASEGGIKDGEIEDLKSVKIYFTETDAAADGVLLDHDDSLAMDNTRRFGLLIHGVQPSKTPAAAAWQKVKMAGGGYGRKNSLRSANRY